MAELPTKITPADVAEPQLLQRAGSIADAQNFNVFVQVSKITKADTVNPVRKTESVNEKFSANQKLMQSQADVASNRGTITGSAFYVGMTSPYPRPNNFLFNERTNTGTTNFEK